MKFLCFVANHYETGNSISSNGTFCKSLDEATAICDARPSYHYAEIFHLELGNLIAKFDSVEPEGETVENPDYTRSNPFDSEISLQSTQST